MTQRSRTFITWLVLLALVVVPIGLAVFSPLLAWRQPIYIAAGFAGVVAMALLLLQPLLASRKLPGVSLGLSNRYHRVVGVSLLFLIMLHVAGLWLTSPPDVIDALLFRSPTPFAPWGVAAMWAVIISAIAALFRRKLPWRLKTWKRVHRTLALVIVLGSVVHAMLIDGTMEYVSKLVLCIAVVLATLMALRVR